VLANGGRVGVGEHFLHGLAGDGVGAIGLLEDLPRDLSGTESRKARLFNEPFERALFGGSELIGRDGNLELDLRWREPVEC
jgi:hypothetical protein